MKSTPFSETPEENTQLQQLQQIHHVRNDSIYSMDSFVADMPEPNERPQTFARSTGDESDQKFEYMDQKFEYISPSSSSAVSVENGNNQKLLESSSMEGDHTEIDTKLRGQHERKFINHHMSSLTDGDGTIASESSFPVPAPVHSFFNQPYFQSDGMSDDMTDGGNGSIVFTYSHDVLTSSNASQHSQVSQQNQTTHNQPMVINNQPQQNQKLFLPTRDRFPSYDSVGSSGSVVRHFPGKSGGQPKPAPSTNAAPPAPRILPYSERRKLQLKQQQQRSQGTTGPPRPDRQPMPFLLPTNAANPPLPSFVPSPPPPADPSTGQFDAALYQQQNQFLNASNVPLGFSPHFPIPFPPYPGMPMPPPAGIPIQPNFSGLYPPPSFNNQQHQFPFDRRLSPFRSINKSADQPRGGSIGASTIKQPNNIRQPPMAPSTGSSISYGRPQNQLTHQQQIQIHSKQTFQDNAGGSTPTSSSFDSSDEYVTAKGPTASIPEEKRFNATSPPPPPPPIPPPPLKAAHVRQSSNGSVSSLGSIDRSSREDNPNDKPSAASDSFFQRWNPWSTKRDTIGDFHRKNQAFLSSLERQSKPAKAMIPAKSSPRVGLRRLPLSSTGTPPPSKGGHRRLQSIDNDDWTERDKKERVNSADTSSIEDSNHSRDAPLPAVTKRELHVGELSSTFRRSNVGERPPDTQMGDEDSGDISSILSSSSEMTNADESTRRSSNNDFGQVNERTRLLPPTGISSKEERDRGYHDASDKSATRGQRYRSSRRSSNDGEWIRSQVSQGYGTAPMDHESMSRRQKKKKKRQGRRYKRSNQEESPSSSSISSSSVSSYNRRKKTNKRSTFSEKERMKLYRKWRAEEEAREEAQRRIDTENQLHRRFARYVKSRVLRVLDTLAQQLSWLESFFANMPLTVGGVALANANLGVDWFKFTEENLKTCQPVHFHSSQCTFPEFPGCFYCDTSATSYRIALNFHHVCSAFAGMLAFCFLAKLLVARRVFFDELSNPTMMAPAGLFCMTLNIVFAGRGILGMCIVFVASAIHLCLASWFIYMAIAYRMLPEPSWFPNTVGIGISAVKTWLYNPLLGQVLMAISLSLNLLFFPISLIRVGLNQKISAPVSWMQMSAPDISLYALTIMAQPSFEEEFPDINNFQKVHRMVYLPLMHVLFTMCLVGMIASVNSLRVRWQDFRRYSFSPAHAAFCAPTLSHANAVQGYRAAIISFSNFPPYGLFRKLLYAYWITVLVCGTALTLYITIKFLWYLPEWTHIDVEGEIEPPAPSETSMTLTNMVATGDTLVQPYVSPAVLQANETGTLVRVSDSRGHRYVRTRQVTALGFEPILNVIQMQSERELLLDWVGKNPPSHRHRSLSVPGIDFNYGSTLGTGYIGVEDSNAPWTHRPRSNSSSPFDRIRRAYRS